MQMKYIRYKNLGVILFESHIEHETMHQRLGNELNELDELLSAGYVSAWGVDDKLEVQASEGSTTLNVNSLPDDADLIKRRLKLY